MRLLRDCMLLTVMWYSIPLWHTCSSCIRPFLYQAASSEAILLSVFIRLQIGLRVPLYLHASYLI
jgi:hypothetical protein